MFTKSNAVFSALSDPTRRALLAALAARSSSVSELAQPHRMSLPSVMKHLRVLEKAGLVAHQKDGRIRRCELRVQPLQDASNWLAHYRVFWEGQLDQLDRYLQQNPKEHSV